MGKWLFPESAVSSHGAFGAAVGIEPKDLLYVSALLREIIFASDKSLSNIISSAAELSLAACVLAPTSAAGHRRKRSSTRHSGDASWPARPRTLRC